MQSSNSRLLSGAVVTFLLLALVALIVVTLLRDGDGASSGISASTGNVAEAPDVNATTQPGQVGETAAIESTSPSVESAAPNGELQETPATAAEPEPSGALSVGDPFTETEAAGISLTIQPTPTRRQDESAVQTSTPEGEASSSLPPVDPAMAPDTPLLVYANPNYVHDLVLLDGALWSATSAGARAWDPATGEAQTYGIPEGLTSPRLRAAVNCPLEGLGLVFGSDAGLEIHDPASGEWVTVGQSTGNNQGLPFVDVSALACSAAANLLAVGSSVNGIALYDAENSSWLAIAPDDEGLLTGVRALAVDEAGAVWVAAGATLLLVVEGEIEEVFDADNSPLTGEAISALAMGADGVLWTTSGDRLFRYADDEWSVYRGANGGGEFPSGTLVAVEPVSGGRVWIASQNADICRFDPELGTCAPWYAGEEGMATMPLTALAVASDGTLAYGTAGSGVSVLGRTGWTVLSEEVSFPTTNRIFALATDTGGYLWVATSGGVQKANPASPEEATLFVSGANGPSATNVRTLYADARGGVWLGGIGASYYDGANWSNYAQGDGLSPEEITSITQDNQGRIWFGTRAGLSIWTGTTFFNLTAENGLPDAHILSLAADANSVWIGSASGGLYRFENNQLQVLTQENVGLPSNRILSLLVAPDRSLYVGTDQGLARFARGEFAPVGGVPADAITSLGQGADGSLWAGTTANGVWTQAAGAQPTRAWTRAESSVGSLPNSVQALAVDLFGGVWLATDSAGLVRFAPE